MTEPVYRLHNFGFGDHWGSMSLLRHMAKASGKRPLLNTFQHGVDFTARVREIDGALGMDGHGITSYRPMITSEKATHALDGADVWQCPLVRTRVQWEFNPHSNIVVYQVDGESAPDKNPSAEDTAHMLTALRGSGFSVMQLGKHLSVNECVSLCAKAVLFVGCCSGMSHLAHSVGVPVYLLEYGLPVITCHRQKQFVICKGVAHFLAESKGYRNVIERLRDMGS